MRTETEAEPKKKTEPKKRVVGRPFKRGQDSRRAQSAQSTEAVELSVFARDLLRSRKVQRAIRRRGEAGELTPQEIRALADIASEAPQEATTAQQRYRETLEQVGRLSYAETMMLTALNRKMLGQTSEDSEVRLNGYAWRLVRRPGAVATAPPVHVSAPNSVSTGAEPELDPVRPLAAASERLKQIEASAGAAPPKIEEIGPRTPPPAGVVVVVQERPAPTYQSWRRVPVRSPRPEDREGASSSIRCDKCGRNIPEIREAAESHDRTGRDGRCKNASFTQV